MTKQKSVLRTDTQFASMFDSRLKYDYQTNYQLDELTRLNFQLEKCTISHLQKCTVCNEQLVYTAFRNNQKICDHCITDMEFKKCHWCKEYTIHGNFIRIENTEKWYCSDCSRERFVNCSVCGTKTLKEDLYCYRGKFICENCKTSEKLTMCGHCGDLFSPFEMDSTSKTKICLKCSLSSKLKPVRKNILNSSHKPTEMVFLSTKQNDNEFLGIELEFQWMTSENRIKVLEFLERYEDHYLKEDGSVSGGCEIVTFPATKDYHISRFKKILFEMENIGCVSHDTGDCGLHIHISRNAFGTNTRTQSKNIAKLLYLIEKFQIQFKKFSRRESKCKNTHGETWTPTSPYRYCEFYNLDYSDGKITRAYQRAVYQNKIKIRRSRYGNEIIRSGRYKVLNFQNKDTVEFRLLRGTLSYKTFCASLEFICLMVKIAKTTSEKDILKLNWMDIVKNTIDTPVLFEYLKKQKLIEG